MSEAYHLIAFVYGDIGQMDKAMAAQARASQLNPTYNKAEAGLSLDSYSAARYEELIGDRNAKPGVAEGGALAHYNLGLAFRQKALYDEALREFRLATERGEDSFLVQQAQGEMLLLSGGNEESKEIYRNLITVEPTSPKLWNELGVAEHQAGDLEAAESAYNRSLELDPAYALAWNNLGVVRHHRDSGDAEAAFRSALREGRALADVWRNLALALHRSGKQKDSLEAYKQAVTVDPSASQAWTGLGILLMELNSPEDARTALLKAVEIDPELPEARYHLAFALSALGDYQGALRETKLALDLNPYIPAPRFKLLIDLQYEEASVLAPELDVAKRVESGGQIQSFDFRPESLDAVFERDALGGAGTFAVGAGEKTAAAASAAQWLKDAEAALERGDLEEATTDAQRAAMSGADRVQVLLLQGQIYLRRGLSGEAVERFNALLAEIGRSDDAANQETARRGALLGAARSLLDLDRVPQALELAEQLYEAAPNDVQALRTLGEAAARMGDHARAAITLERARIHAPDDVALLTQLGTAYAHAGDPDGAESALRRAVSVNASAVAARTQLGLVLIDEERHAEGEAVLRNALLTLPSNAPAALALADLYAGRGRVRDAMHTMVDLLTLDPYHMDALVRLAELLEQAGMPEQAAVALRRVLRFDPRNDIAQAMLARVAPDMEQ
jgi:tetratricopeptide (TPR) repeat protein